MKRLLITALLGVIGCISPNAEQRFVNDIADKRILLQPLPPVSQVQDIFTEFERRWNNKFASSQPIHIKVMSNRHRGSTNAPTGSAVVDDPFAALRLPLTDSNTLFFGSAMLNPVEYAKLIAEATGMRVELAPKSRTIIVH
jgi:hypothetical protein